MKLYIITDMEGVAGVARWDECRPAPDGRDLDYERSRKLLTLEVAAAVEGALEAGADEVVVSDGHRGGGNLLAELLPRGGRYLLGKGKPRPVAGLDPSFDGVMLLGYHSMSSSGGLLCHTMNPRLWDRFLVNGTEIGEIGLMALAAGGHGVPVWIVTGGDYACDEAAGLLGEDLVTVRVKQDLSHESCNSMAPEDAREVIKAAVRSTLQSPPSTKPFTVRTPITYRLEFRTARMAGESGIPDRLRVDERSFEYRSDSPWAYRVREWK